MNTAAVHASSLVLRPSPLSTDEQLKIVIVGHVDHGKSTLVGRLLYETDSLPDGKYDTIKASCDKRGMAFEWAFLMDALQAERDQNVTIDTTQIWFSTALRRYCLIDAPGHREFLKNMITGAASAEAALLLIDAQEGVKEQSKRHGYLLSLLGIKQVGVVINKMDLVGYDQARFEAVRKEYAQYLGELGVDPLAFVPISAREGDMIKEPSEKMGWYDGPTVTQLLDQFTPMAEPEDQPLRFMVQDVYRFDERRIIAGRIESGTLKVGDELLFSPSGLSAKVKSFERWPEEAPAIDSASAGQSVGIRLAEQIFVERGQIGSHDEQAPILTPLIHSRLFWLSETPLKEGNNYRMKLGTNTMMCEVKKINKVIDTNELSSDSPEHVGKHQVAEVSLRIKGTMAVDDHGDLPRTGRFMLFDGYDVAGGGIISTEGLEDQRIRAKDIKSSNLVMVDYEIEREKRAQVNGHLGGVLWFTGLSGSGKSTLAKELQRRLFQRGYQVYVLDGDNVRAGLCSDLGFSPEDRTENIRRIGEVASLFADAGVIVITAFISPYNEDRRRARTMASQYFNTVYIKASVEACEARDVKGLYQKARAGEIKEFTGISAPYEEPKHPDLVIDTEAMDIDACVDELVRYVDTHLVKPVARL